MKAAIYTLGCKVNQYESQAMTESLQRNGYEIVDHHADADVYIVNSCTVTAESDRKTRQAVRRLKRNHPDAVVALCGCMPQAFPAAASALDEADIVIGNKGKDAIADALNCYFRDNIRYVSIQPQQDGEAFSGNRISSYRERTRANIKIEDGCNRFCAYCIIPHARGRVRSKPLADIQTECETLARNGFLEIVFVGINLSAYGSDCGKTLCDAAALAASFPSILRVRLGSLEPDHLSADFIAGLSQIPKLCPQFHISLQSGCDRTLARMNRHYNTQEYRRLCNQLRADFPDCTLTTDIMVGFPGETDADFAVSLAFVREIGFEKVHIFPYSPRGGTKAATMPGQIPRSVKEARCRKLAAATQEIREAYLQSQVGKILHVLPEEFHADGTMRGYTANYTPVIIANCQETADIVSARITGIAEDCCLGEYYTNVV